MLNVEQAFVPSHLSDKRPESLRSKQNSNLNVKRKVRNLTTSSQYAESFGEIGVIEGYLSSICLLTCEGNLTLEIKNDSWELSGELNVYFGHMVQRLSYILNEIQRYADRFVSKFGRNLNVTFTYTQTTEIYSTDD